MGNGKDDLLGGIAAMVQLAPGVRMDSSTLDEALHVAEVAAREGGRSLLPDQPKPGTISRATRAASKKKSTLGASQAATKAVHELLEESGLGFEIYSASSEDGAGIDQEVPRPPTWFVDVIYEAEVHVEADANRDANATGTSFFKPRKAASAEQLQQPPRTAMVSVGLTINLVPAIGVIYDAISDRLYAARVGKRTTCNGGTKGIGVRRPPRKVAAEHSSTDGTADGILPEQLVVCTTVQPPDVHERTAYQDHVCGTMRNLMTGGIYNIRICGSPASAVLMVIQGAAHGYYACGPRAAEMCAGLVLVQMAGGFVRNIGDDTEDQGMKEMRRQVGLSSAHASDRPVPDVGARRFLCCSSVGVEALLKMYMAGPIPYATRDDEHPLQDDMTLTHDAAEPSRGNFSTPVSPRISSPSAERWSDQPEPAKYRLQAPLHSVIVAKSKMNLFGTLRRKPTEVVIEFDDDEVEVPKLKGPRTRREGEVLRYCNGAEGGDVTGAVPEVTSSAPGHLRDDAGNMFGDADNAALLADLKNGMPADIARLFGASRTHMMAPTQGNDILGAHAVREPSALLSEVGELDRWSNNLGTPEDLLHAKINLPFPTAMGELTGAPTCGTEEPHEGDFPSDALPTDEPSYSVICGNEADDSESDESASGDRITDPATVNADQILAGVHEAERMPASLASLFHGPSGTPNPLHHIATDGPGTAVGEDWEEDSGPPPLMSARAPHVTTPAGRSTVVSKKPRANGSPLLSVQGRNRSNIHQEVPRQRRYQSSKETDPDTKLHILTQRTVLSPTAAADRVPGNIMEPAPGTGQDADDNADYLLVGGPGSEPKNGQQKSPAKDDYIRIDGSETSASPQHAQDDDYLHVHGV
eukprot:m.1274074 g.1274074  ORF g.1274074 m.1274074 type:complete len:868 (-) comp24757_c0_seq6:1428-4031(-)